MEGIITLRQCFDAQKYCSNAGLAALIADTMNRCDCAPIMQELPDEALDVWAAGDGLPAVKKKLNETEEG